MASVRMLVHTCIVYAIGLFWTSLVLLRMLWLIIRKPTKFFHTKKREIPPPCLNNPDLGTHNYVRLEAIRIHYVSNGSEDNPLMLLLHGFPESWYSWRHQLKEFSKSYRVVAIDTRGYGETDKPESVYEYRASKLTEDIRQLIPALGYQSCVLVGHDWGGVMAWTAAMRYPDLVERLVVMNCPHPFVFGRYMRTHMKQFLKSWYMFFFNYPYVPEMLMRSGDFKMLENTFCGRNMGCKPGMITEDDLEAFKYGFREPGSFTPPLNYIRANIRTPEQQARASLASNSNITKPVLMIWGSNDGALESEMATISGKYCDDYTLEFVEGASHWVQQDDPQTVNNLMWKFLKR